MRTTRGFVITSYSIHYTKLYDVEGIEPERRQNRADGIFVRPQIIGVHFGGERIDLVLERVGNRPFRGGEARAGDAVGADNAEFRRVGFE